MKGIIYKDYMTALLPKNLISMFSNILAALAVAILLGNFYGFALAIMLLAFSGSTLLQVSMEQDEASNFDKLQLTFPLTKKEIVLSKYIGGLGLQLVCFLISLFVSLGYYWVGIVTFITAMQVWLVGIIGGLIFFAISYTGFYLLGNKRGSIMYIVSMLILAIMYVLTFLNFNIVDILTVNHNLLLATGMVVAIIVMVISFRLSLKIYTKRYS